MTPRHSTQRRFFGRRFLLLAGIAAITGCAPHLLRLQSPDLNDTLAESDSSDVKLVGDYASPWGLNYMKVESIGLVTRLNGTGSSPHPSNYKTRLLAEIQTHNIKSPDDLLASPDTAMVLVQGFIPPAARKGDTFDVEIRIPGKSETASLAGGWLMPSRMRHLELLGGETRSSDIAASATGGVLIDALFEGDDDQVLKTRGHILGGGEVRQPRKLGLRVRRGSHSVKITALIARAINARFFTYVRGGIKRGVATARDDKFIELDVPPQYQNNVTRYMAVIRNLAVSETPAARLDRTNLLRQQLLDPTSTAVTALRLEAMGEESAPALESALTSEHPEARFYAAEALAYLGQSSAVEPLAEAAENEAAFRWHAITALAAMDDYDSVDALSGLFHSNSAETRYGAFRALRVRSPDDPLVNGVRLGDRFSYHVVSTVGEPLVHFSRTRRDEIVLFGYDQRMQPPGVINAGREIMIRGVDAEHVKVIRFRAGSDENLEKLSSTKVDDVIRAIVELGGGYSEVLKALQEAKAGGHLESRLAIDSLPKTNRRFYRDDDGDETPKEGGGVQYAGPLPELFRTGSGRSGGHLHDESQPKEAASENGLVGRMKEWMFPG